MKRLCSWCKKDIDTGEQLTDEEYKRLSEDATHGMCPECYREQTKRIGRVR